MELVKIKVLDLINTDKSAKELLLDRALYFQKVYDIENHILCSDGDYVPILRKYGVNVYVVNTPRNLNIFTVLKATIKVIGIIKKEKYDIIHSHGSVLGIISRLAGVFTNVYVIHTVHGFHFHKNMNKVVYKIFFRIEKFLMNLSDIVLSQNFEDFKLLQSFKSKKPVKHIGNGIKINRNEFIPRKMDTNDYFFSCIARFEEVKNHKMLFDVMSILKNDGFDFILKCFGDGHLESYYMNYAKECNLEDCIKFYGYIDNVFDHLDDVHLNFLTSIKEGLPRAILEPMLAGIPTVATDVKGNNEVVENGKTGFLAELNNCREMADKAEKILKDPILYEQMSIASRKRVIDKFNEDQICENLYIIYKEMLAGIPEDASQKIK